MRIFSGLIIFSLSFSSIANAEHKSSWTSVLASFVSGACAAATTLTPSDTSSHKMLGFGFGACASTGAIVAAGIEISKYNDGWNAHAIRQHRFLREAVEGSLERAMEFLEAGALVDEPCDGSLFSGPCHGETALDLVAKRGDIERVKFLLTQGATPSISLIWSPSTPVEISELLIDHRSTVGEITNSFRKLQGPYFTEGLYQFAGFMNRYLGSGFIGWVAATQMALFLKRQQ